MTESLQSAGAAGRMSTETPASERAVLLTRRRPGHLGPLHVIQLLLIEAAAVAILASLTRGVIAISAAVAGGLLLLFATVGRQKGRWWVERRLMARRYRRRGRAVPARDNDARLAALRALAPGLTVQDVPAADGAQVGVAHDGAGWFAAAVISTTTPMRDDPGERLPLGLLASALAEMAQPGAVLQVVRHTVPTPSLDIHPASPAGQSYRQLLAGLNAPAPMDGVTWVTIRLDERALAEADTEAGSQLHRAPAVVAALVRGVAKSLRRAGISYHVLDSAGLVGALARSCDLDAPANNGSVPRERWDQWHSVGLAHRTFWVRRWPAVDRAAALLDSLTTATVATTSVALILAPDYTEELIDMRCLVRVAAPAAALDQICQAITKSARLAHADLFPLDGEQGPAVYASAPTGGGPR